MDTLSIILYAGAMLFAIATGCVRNYFYYREEIDVDIRTHLGSPLSSLSSLEDLET